MGRGLRLSAGAIEGETSSGRHFEGHWGQVDTLGDCQRSMRLCGRRIEEEKV